MMRSAVIGHKTEITKTEICLRYLRQISWRYRHDGYNDVKYGTGYVAAVESVSWVSYCQIHNSHMTPDF